MWANFTRYFTSRLFKTLDELGDYLKKTCKAINADKLKSICGLGYIYFAQF